jgi:hypothetical protein
MSVREKINSNKVMGFLVGAILLVVATVQAAYFLWPSKPHQSATGTFYTDDDGQTYFMDSIYKFPPWDHNGKQANMAMVYSSDSGNFVAYQVRFMPAAQKQLQDLYAKALRGECPLADVNRLMTTPQIGVGGKQMKVRGSDKWVPFNRVTVKAPDGSDPLAVLP